MLFERQVSVGIAILGLCALGAWAAPPRATRNPKATRPTPTPTPAPVEEILDGPSEHELRLLLQQPNAPGAEKALGNARAAAYAAGDFRKWYQYLGAEVRAGLGSSWLIDSKAQPVSVPSMISRVEAALPGGAPVEVQITHTLLLAELHLRAAGWPRTEAERQVEAYVKHRGRARDLYASAFAMRQQLAERSREALPFATEALQWHPTARDVVSYLYAAYLEREADSPLLGSAEVRRLLGSLPKGPEAEPSAVAKACAVLDDLERWHAQSPSPARKVAALQARIERTRLLYRWFPSQPDRALVCENLEKYLPAFRDDPAWADGMAQLALLVNEIAAKPEEPLAIARQAERAYPRSPGGTRAASIARILSFEIEDPEIGLALAPGGIRVSHSRAATLKFRAVPEPAEAVLEDRLWLTTAFRAAPVEPSNEAAQNAISWTTELPEPPSGQPSTTFVRAPMPGKGLYRTEVSLGNGPPQDRPLWVLVTDLAIVARRNQREVQVWVVDPANGNPISHADVRLFRRTHRPKPASIPLSSRTTDAEGRASFELPSDVEPGEMFALVARKGDDMASAFVEQAYGAPAARPTPVPADPDLPILSLSFDRTRGVAGETTRWKARASCPGPGGRLVPAAGLPLTVAFRGAETSPVSADSFGRAAGEVVLPRLAEDPGKGWTFELAAGRTCSGAKSEALGPLKASLPPREPSAGFEIAIARTPLISGVPGTIAGTASRNGAPLDGALVTWEITASGRTIPRRASGGSPVPVPQRVAEGTARTDAEGRFAISLVGPEVQEAPPWWNLRVDVRAADGEGVSVNRGISGWPASVTLALSGRTVYRKGEPVEIGLTRRSVSDGAPRPGKSTVTVQRLSRFEADARDDSNPWAFAGEVATEKALERAAVAEDVRSDVVLCDAMGEGRVSLPLEPGFYRAVVTTLDAAGRRAETRRAFVVDGPGLQSPVPLTFLVDAAETGPRRVFLKGSSGRAFADLVRESGPVETRSILGNGDSVVDLDVASEEPVAVNGYAVRKGQWVSMNRSVPARHERLSIALVSGFPTLEMRVTTAQGEPLGGIALRAAAVPEDSEVREYDPHPGAWWPSRSVSLLRLGILAHPDGVPVRPEASSEWYSVNVPVAPAERALLHEEHYSFECGTSMIQVRPSLPREDRPSYGFQRASVVDARRDAPAELWAPGLVTDERGIASVPFLPRPGTAYRMTATAIAKDGRTGFFSGRVVASTSATEETK